MHQGDLAQAALEFARTEKGLRRSLGKSGRVNQGGTRIVVLADRRVGRKHCKHRRLKRLNITKRKLRNHISIVSRMEL